MSYNVTPSTAATSNRSLPGKPDNYSSTIYSMPQHRAIMNKTADSNGKRGSFVLPGLPKNPILPRAGRCAGWSGALESPSVRSVLDSQN